MIAIPVAVIVCAVAERIATVAEAASDASVGTPASV